MRWTPLAVLATLSFLGCSSDYTGDQDINVESTSQEIIGGTPTTADPAIIAIFTHKPGAQEGALCTATLISPTVLLTAAHCVDPKLVGEDTQTIAAFGADINAPETAGTIAPVAETHFNPLFNSRNPAAGYDIAVAILKDPVSITPMPFMHKPLEQSLVGKTVRLVGYGVTNGFNNQGAGVKRTVSTDLKSFDDKLVRFGALGRTICSGDSGGPVLMEVDGKETVVGVNSFGMLFCLTGASSTRVDSYLDFIGTYVKE